MLNKIKKLVRKIQCLYYNKYYSWVELDFTIDNYIKLTGNHKITKSKILLGTHFVRPYTTGSRHIENYKLILDNYGILKRI